MDVPEKYPEECSSTDTPFLCIASNSRKQGDLLADLFRGFHEGQIVVPLDRTGSPTKNEAYDVFSERDDGVKEIDGREESLTYDNNSQHQVTKPLRLQPSMYGYQITFCAYIHNFEAFTVIILIIIMVTGVLNVGHGLCKSKKTHQWSVGLLVDSVKS